MKQETPIEYFNKLEMKEEAIGKELLCRDWHKSIAYSLAIIAENVLKYAK
jgi:hypothetical protein